VPTQATATIAKANDYSKSKNLGKGMDAIKLVDELPGYGP